MLLLIKQFIFGAVQDEVPNIAKGGYSSYPSEQLDFNSTFTNIHKQLK